MFIFSAEFSCFENLGGNGKDNNMMCMKVCQKLKSHKVLTNVKCQYHHDPHKPPIKFTKTLLDYNLEVKMASCTSSLPVTKNNSQ